MLILGPKNPHLPYSGYNKNFSQKSTRVFLGVFLFFVKNQKKAMSQSGENGVADGWAEV